MKVVVFDITKIVVEAGGEDGRSKKSGTVGGSRGETTEGVSEQLYLDT